MKTKVKIGFKYNQKGITLIALVITIIVLLILAGVSIAMLTGENGILSRATEAKEATRGGEVKETVTLAATNNAGVEHIGGTKQTKTDVITQLHNDEKLTDSEVTTLEENDTIVIGGITIDFSVLGGEDQTTSTVVFKNGTEIVETPEVGNDVEIGDEKFKVIKITGNKVTAMPYYNLDLTGTDIKQQTSGDTAYDTEQKVTFSSVASPTWSTSQNIDLDTHTNNVKTPIESYQTYLRGLGANNVEAKIGRSYPTTQEGATITEAEYIGDLSGLNPGEAGDFWLGSSDSVEARELHYVTLDGYISIHKRRRNRHHGRLLGLL